MFVFQPSENGRFTVYPISILISSLLGRIKPGAFLRVMPCLDVMSFPSTLITTYFTPLNESSGDLL